eukprot:6179738-Pleurochrysis_carterae.AAC.1
MHTPRLVSAGTRARARASVCVRRPAQVWSDIRTSDTIVGVSEGVANVHAHACPRTHAHACAAMRSHAPWHE